MSRKRLRETRDVNVQMVEIYDDLANENEEIRIKAALALVSKLSTDKALTGGQVERVVNRLFRGLSSGRKAARIGFSIALTESLSQLLGAERTVFPGLKLDVSRVLDLLEEQTRGEGNVSGQEKRDLYFGRLFGSEAIIKSAILFGPAAQRQHWDRVLDIIFDIAKRKKWLREECGWVLYEAIQSIASQSLDSNYAQSVIDRLASHGLTKTPEGVAIWLAVRSAFPAVNLPQGFWYRKDPLQVMDVEILAKVLREASASQEAEAAGEGSLQRGLWNPNLHFTWDILLEHFFNNGETHIGDDSDTSGRLTFADFWIAVIDKHLYSISASPERKYWGFQMASKVIRDAPVDLARHVFSGNFMVCLMHQLASPERYLHLVAQKFLKTLLARAKVEPSLPAIVIVVGLMGVKGVTDFDQMTNTKIVEKLMVHADAAGMVSIIDHFEKLFRHPRVCLDDSGESRRLLFCDQLLAAVRSRKIGDLGLPTESDWILHVLAMFVKYGYFNVEKEDGLSAPSPTISNATQSIARSRISSCLAHLMSRPGGTAFAYQVVLKLRKLEDDENGCQSLLQADKFVRRKLKHVWKSLQKIHERLGATSDEDRACLEAFEMLYCLTILQVYNGDPEGVLVLDEIKLCYDGLVKHRSETDKKATHYLIDMLLSILSKPSVLFRRLAEQVFTVFTSELDADNMRALLEMLATKESLAGQQALFDSEEQVGSDVELEDASDVDEMSDAAAAGGDEAAVDDINADTGPEDAETSDDSDVADAAADEELALFDAKLGLALGTRRCDFYNDDASMDKANEPSDADMDDEQMEALDVYLENIFKERKNTANKKKEKKDAKETVVNLKLRVLDLLRIYVKREHTNPTALELVLPLLELIRTTSNKQVSEKACVVVREYAQLCKGKAVPRPTDESPAWELLKAVHREAAKQASRAHATACSQSSLLLAKVLVALNKENILGVIDVYADTRKQQFTNKKANIQPALFSDWNNWCTSASKQLQD